MRATMALLPQDKSAPIAVEKRTDANHDKRDGPMHYCLLGYPSYTAISRRICACHGYPMSVHLAFKSNRAGEYLGRSRQASGRRTTRLHPNTPGGNELLVKKTCPNLGASDTRMAPHQQHMFAVSMEKNTCWLYVGLQCRVGPIGQGNGSL
jgi:hypothetical protein